MNHFQQEHSSAEISTLSWLRKRKLGHRGKPKFLPNRDFMQRMKQEVVLDGHMGCVNCIEWNQDGSLLASGSDDSTIIIWDPYRKTQKRTVTTGHQGNIFSVKFIPDTCDTLVASSASDNCVKLTDSITSRNLLNCTGCHTDRVKRLAVHQDEPNLIWSSGEDGLILQYDIRENHICGTSSSRHILLDLGSICARLKAKCLAINPIKSEMLAVGATDIYNRLFDRRYLGHSNKKERACIAYFAPGHLLKSNNRSNQLQSYGTTYLSFSPDGSELLASVHAEQVYLFDLNEPWKRYKTFECSLKSQLDFRNDLLGKELERNQSSSCKPVHWWHMNHWPQGFYNNPKTSRTSIYDKYCHIDPEFEERLHRQDWRSLRETLESFNDLLLKTKDCPELYIARAKILLVRGWRGDFYQALRDCCCALILSPLHLEAIRSIADALNKLGQTHSIEGLIKFIKMKKDNVPTVLWSNYEEALIILREYRDVALREVTNCDNNNDCDMMILDEDLDNEKLTCSLMSSGGNSLRDIFDLLESTKHRKLDKLHRFDVAYDYSQRFCGHCNMNTDIKEANFFGPDGKYLVGGSDDGAFYIWDKQSSNIVKAVNADYQILNCVQPHPNICMLATSGVEPTVKLWSPIGGGAGHDVSDLDTRCIQNQKYISSDPLEAMILMMYPELRNPE